MTIVGTAAWTAAILLGGVATFQLALAAGSPLGEMSFGGRAETVDRVLSGSYRVMSGAAAVVLLLAAWIVLAHAGIATSGPMAVGFLEVATWVIFGYLALNTVMNAASSHPVERFGLGLVTLLSSIACFIVAQSAVSLIG